MTFARTAVCLAAACLVGAARADLPTETFEGGTPSNAAVALGPIAGTGFRATSGVVFLTTSNDPAHGRILDLSSGFYSNYDPVTRMGSSSAETIATFDLLAGTTYTLDFDLSRQGFSAGNGPFPTALVASLGSFSRSFPENVGFFFGESWSHASLSWVQATTELAQAIRFAATGDGYSGMLIDNVAMAGLPPTVVPPVTPVPEPETWALMLAGLAGLGHVARRRRATARSL